MGANREASQHQICYITHVSHPDCPRISGLKPRVLGQAQDGERLFGATHLDLFTGIEELGLEIACCSIQRNLPRYLVSQSPPTTSHAGLDPDLKLEDGPLWAEEIAPIPCERITTLIHGEANVSIGRNTQRPANACQTSLTLTSFKIQLKTMFSLSVKQTQIKNLRQYNSESTRDPSSQTTGSNGR